MIMPFGIYKNEPIMTIAIEDPQYLEWVLENCQLKPDLEEAIMKALQESDTLSDHLRESRLEF